VAELGLHDLDDAWILASGETPIPYSPTLEDAFLPSTEAILASIRSRLGVGSSALSDEVQPVR
jgi:pyruvate/2-oxoglutarate/acetoin dehydrogenase E1 component